MGKVVELDVREDLQKKVRAIPENYERCSTARSRRYVFYCTLHFNQLCCLSHKSKSN